jgi:transglutaminase/protease-like cytokinesis protein 3
MDASLASPTFPDRTTYSDRSDEEIDYFYFLTPPKEFIFTHVPRFAQDEHLVPPIQLSDALALPLKTPAAFESEIDLVDYHSALTCTENLEVAELDFSVPQSMEMYAEVSMTRTSTEPAGSFGTGVDRAGPRPGGCLAQAYWRDGKRRYRVKAVLPEDIPLGVLRVYAADRKTLKAFGSSTMKLVYTFGVSHRGTNAPFEFVTRHCTPHFQRHDLYVGEPQCKRLAGGNNYKFSVRQHPSGGVTSGSGFGPIKLGIQSPSGRITKLVRMESDSQIAASWEASIKTLEVGVWRGLVLADRGNAWSVFAEWHCM